MTRKITFCFSSAVFAILVLAGCADLKKLSQTYSNLQKVEFKLQSVKDFRLKNISFSGKNSVSDFSMTEGAKLLRLFNSKEMPVSFVLNLAARNPEDRQSGKKSVSSTITNIDWRLFIDDKLTVSGTVTKDVTIPGTGETEIIPIGVNLDIYKFFGGKRYEDVLKLALALGGVGDNTSRLRLDIKPSVKTQFGPINYPGRIDVIDKEFRSK